MTSAFVPLLGPLIYSFIAYRAFQLPGQRPRGIAQLTESAAIGVIIVAAVSLFFLISGGPGTSGLVGVAGLGLAIRLDALSVTLLSLVSFVGWVVLRFAATYMDGEKRQGAFTGWLCTTLASVMLLVTAGNLFQLVMAWIATSICLHRLLLHYPERLAAQRAARKKFVTARVGDVSILLAAILLYLGYGTGDIARILAAAHMGEGQSVAVWVAALLALAALLKSAQFPAHGWLTEVMETPTPVSALLHAGVINAGGFLLIRFADVMLLAPVVLAALVLIGGFTALFGGLVMLTQSSVKTSLAWSTVAQMGFMILQCGLALFPLALLHIVAHSLYKAHAFLASGMAVEGIAGLPRPGPVAIPSGRAVLRAFLIALSIYALVGLLFGFQDKSAQAIALGAILVFGVAYLLAQGLADAAPRALTKRTIAYSIAATVAYFALHNVTQWLMRDTLPATPMPGSLEWALIILSLISFAIVAVAQSMFPLWAYHPASAGLRVHLSNGLYANAVLDRLLGGWACEKSARAAIEVSNSEPLQPEALNDAADTAARAIAPMWPLSSSVAVNPYLGQTHQTLANTGALLARISDASVTMSREWYLQQISSQRINDEDLRAAIDDAPENFLCKSVDELKRAAAIPKVATEALPTVANLAAETSGIDWPGILADRFSMWASGYFDEGQALWAMRRDRGAYLVWKQAATHDLAPEILGLQGFAQFVDDAPDTAERAIHHAASLLELDVDSLQTYLHQLLLGLGGWSQYARYRQWQAELAGNHDNTITDLLAIRLLWEAALYSQYKDLISGQWFGVMQLHSQFVTVAPDLQLDVVLQSAMEHAAHRELATVFADSPGQAIAQRPALQAAFCIDVRSEVFRRSLESVDAHIQTVGFAGFFGLSTAHKGFASDVIEKRLPVLLNPGVSSVSGNTTTSAVAQADLDARLRARAKRAWGRFKLAAVSSFAFVEAAGPIYVSKLLRDSLQLTPKPVPNDPAPVLDPALDDRASIDAAESILRAMSLTADFAPLVLIAGHGANVVNNPYASALHCGACGGFSGEVNARLLAALLNEPSVRQALESRGISIPADTLFIGALHDTTTDRVTMYDADRSGQRHIEAIKQAQLWLQSAGRISRAERALRLPRAHGEQDIDLRSRDWAEVRPEWGLAGCQAFIAAPRYRTAGQSLAGRAFLHDYHWAQDEKFGVLELIMTAPVVVASWISLQYYGSTVAPRVLGAGNKLLHNIVGGIGVVEGNGGMLRNGLPMQSVHDGEEFVHTPLRLAVCIEAPRDAMNDILQRHDNVRALFDNQWLYLFAIDENGNLAWRYSGDLQWSSLDYS